MGGQLGNIANLVDLNSIDSIDGLYNYVGSIVLKGGVLEYTRGSFESKYLNGSSNLANLNLGRNFDTGARLIEDSPIVMSNVFYKYKDSGNLDKDDRPSVDKLRVGDLYDINKSKGDNSGKRIITEEGFYNFEKKNKKRANLEQIQKGIKHYTRNQRCSRYCQQHLCR